MGRSSLAQSWCLLVLALVVCQQFDFVHCVDKTAATATPTTTTTTTTTELSAPTFDDDTALLEDAGALEAVDKFVRFINKRDRSCFVTGTNTMIHE